MKNLQYVIFRGIISRFDLHGSKRQIIWAKNIRNKIAWDIFKTIDTHDTRAFESWLLHHTDAQWWIENRYNEYYIVNTFYNLED